MSVNKLSQHDEHHGHCIKRSLERVPTLTSLQAVSRKFIGTSYKRTLATTDLNRAEAL